MEDMNHIDSGGKSEERSALLPESRDSLASGPGWCTGGFGTVTATTFIVSIIAGTGVLVLPVALAKTGWFGLIAFAVIGSTADYTGVILGRCWIILQERFEIYRQQTRYPYAAIAYESFGRPGRVIATLTINISLYTMCVAFMLIISENTSLILQLESVNTCTLMPFVGLMFCPMVCIGTPKEFWPVAVVGALSTGLACLLLLFSIVQEVSLFPSSDVTYRTESAMQFLYGTGIFLVVISGHTVYPTIQHDMREPKDFPRSVVLASFVVALYFAPIAVAGYYVFGDDLIHRENVFEVLSPSLAKTAALSLVTIHVVCAFVISMNPVFQDVEELLGIGTDFTWKRIASRVTQVILITVVGLFIPDFTKIMSFGGGTGVMLLCFIYPVAFYLRLCFMSSPTDNWPDRTLSKSIVAILLVVGTASVVMAIAVTSSSLIPYGEVQAGNYTYARPCYL